MLMLSCEGGEHTENEPAVARQAVYDVASSGGRAFAVSRAAREVHTRLAMSTSKTWGGRAIAIGVAVLAASQVIGCTRREPISPDAVRTSGRADLEVVLADGTSVRLDDASSSGDRLCGKVYHFHSPSFAVRSFVLQTKGYYVPEITPAADADPAAMDSLMDSPFAASRLALAFRVATRAPTAH